MLGRIIFSEQGCAEITTHALGREILRVMVLALF